MLLAAAALYVLSGLGKAARRGPGSLPSAYSASGSGTPLHPGPLDRRMGLKHYILNGSPQALFWGWNLLLFSVQPSPLVDSRLTAYTLNATDCVLLVHCKTPLMSSSLIVPHAGFFFFLTQ